MTVREMLSKLDSRELSEWFSFYQLEQAGITGRKQSAEELKTILTAMAGVKKKQRTSSKGRRRK